MAAPSVRPMHATSSCSLFARPVGQRALELEKGAADFVAQSDVAVLVVDSVAPEVVAAAVFAFHGGFLGDVCFWRMEVWVKM